MFIHTWMKGKTAASITFVNEAQRRIQDPSMHPDYINRLVDEIVRLKTGQHVLAQYFTVDQFLAS